MERCREAWLVAGCIRYPFPILYPSNSRRPHGHWIAGQRTVGERSLVPGHRDIRRVRGTTIMSPGVSQPGRTRMPLFASSKMYQIFVRKYERSKTSVVSQRWASESSVIWNLFVEHFEIIEVGNCNTEYYFSQTEEN